ncbi:MAG: hypothetical protein JW829_13970 [Pirellulales bacterium]|nr:hypothetical protein [Pirellulales bacterium]
MPHRFLAFLVPLAALCMLAAAPVLADPILAPGDFIIGIDTDPATTFSSYPANENPFNALDSDSATKYLNFGEVETGFIVEGILESVVQSIQLTTANDAVERDPLSWELYGTNDLILSVDNGDGSAENWTLIAEGDANLPPERLTLGSVQSFSNTTSYTSYRILFPTVKDPAAANSMQIADVNLYPTPDGSGLSIWESDGYANAIAFQLLQYASRSPANETVENILDGNGIIGILPSESSYPDAEGPGNAVDGTLAKYLNFGKNNSGFIVTPTFGASQVQSFQITTANDAVERDPISWALYGTNEAIASADNSNGNDENWILVDSGSITLPAERNTVGSYVAVNNDTAYTSYKMIFPEVADPVLANSMQIAEIEFFESADGTGTDILNLGDPVLAIDVDELYRYGTETKYLNFGRENSGFIVTPAVGSSVIAEFQITTANDWPERDPTSYELYGTNDPITSEADSQGDGENWVLIASGTIALPEERFTPGDLITVSNTTSYTSYKMIFPTLRNAAATDSMQVSGIQFFGTTLAQDDADFDGDGDVDGADFLAWQAGFGITGTATRADGDANGDKDVDADDLAIWNNQFGTISGGSQAGTAIPEPATCLMGILGLLAMVLWRSRRWE